MMKVRVSACAEAVSKRVTATVAMPRTGRMVGSRLLGRFCFGRYYIAENASEFVDKALTVNRAAAGSKRCDSEFHSRPGGAILDRPPWMIFRAVVASAQRRVLPLRDASGGSGRIPAFAPQLALDGGRSLD